MDFWKLFDPIWGFTLKTVPGILDPRISWLSFWIKNHKMREPLVVRNINLLFLLLWQNLKWKKNAICKCEKIYAIWIFRQNLSLSFCKHRCKEIKFPIVDGEKNSIFANYKFHYFKFCQNRRNHLRNTTLNTMSIIFTLHHTTYGLWTAQNGVI